jgi:hypothetical protein
MKGVARLGHWFARSLEASRIPVVDENGVLRIEVRMWASFPDSGVVYLPPPESCSAEDAFPQQWVAGRVEGVTDHRNTDDQQ